MEPLLGEQGLEQALLWVMGTSGEVPGGTCGWDLGGERRVDPLPDRPQSNGGGLIEAVSQADAIPWEVGGRQASSQSAGKAGLQRARHSEIATPQALGSPFREGLAGLGTRRGGRLDSSTSGGA